MKELKRNKVLATPFLTQTLKGVFFKVGLVAIVLITLIGTQLGQTREDLAQHKSADKRELLVLGDNETSNSCLKGEILGAYDKPIYNEERTLIIDWEEAWMCFPEGI